MSASQSRIAETLEMFYTADRTSDVGTSPEVSQDDCRLMMLLPQGAMAGHAYKSAVDELDNSVGRDLDAPFRATVLEPVGKLCSYYPAINDAIAKRNKKVNRLKRIFCYHIKLILPPGLLIDAGL
jgi:hypothetical protein